MVSHLFAPISPCSVPKSVPNTATSKCSRLGVGSILIACAAPQRAAHHVSWAPLPSTATNTPESNMGVTGKPVGLRQMQDLATRPRHLVARFVWCAAGFEIRDGCCSGGYWTGLCYQ